MVRGQSRKPELGLIGVKVWIIAFLDILIQILNPTFRTSLQSPVCSAGILKSKIDLPSQTHILNYSEDSSPLDTPDKQPEAAARTLRWFTAAILLKGMEKSQMTFC